MAASMEIGAISASNLIIWLVIGLIAGWLAGQVMSGEGYCVVEDIVTGLLAAILHLIRDESVTVRR